MNRPSIDYKQIYTDILDWKFPQKKDECQKIISKNELSTLDVIDLNRIIFGTKNIEDSAFNRAHRSYGKSDILQILDYQKKNGLNNRQLANHFKLSRNTIAKWKKQFL